MLSGALKGLATEGTPSRADKESDDPDRLVGPRDQHIDGSGRAYV